MLGLRARTTPAASPHDLTARAFAALDERLCADISAPVCVAVSGGGDSMALLALACDWGRARGRSILALSVDHGLQPDGAVWSALALETAGRLGAEARLLRWEGPKPATGVSAAARLARHALLADAAREAGAGVILMAHTADDIAEGHVLRAEGSNLGDLRVWGPSPAWPQGRGVFLLRPLLGERRAALRDYLTARGIDWIEDPANSDLKYGRARARAHLSQSRHPGIREADVRDPAAQLSCGDGQLHPRAGWVPDNAFGISGMTALLEACGATGGGLSVSRSSLRAAAPATARRFLAAALLCAAGTTRPARGEALDALLARLRKPGPVDATLAGARVLARDDEILIGRDMGRDGLQPLPLEPAGVSVWDGRFEITVNAPGLSVLAAQGLMARLSAPDRKQLQGLAPILRGSQPLIVDFAASGDEVRPVLAERIASVRALAGHRLLAACGQIAHEREIGTGVVAPEVLSPYVGLERP